MFFKIDVLKRFAILTGKHLCWSFFLIRLQAWRPATLLKSRLQVLRNCYEHIFYRTPPVVAFEADVKRHISSAKNKKMLKQYILLKLFTIRISQKKWSSSRKTLENVFSFTFIFCLCVPEKSTTLYISQEVNQIRCSF